MAKHHFTHTYRKQIEIQSRPCNKEPINPHQRIYHMIITITHIYTAGENPHFPFPSAAFPGGRGREGISTLPSAVDLLD